jgi:predicted phage terminase large subunit-like protein
MGNLVQEPIAQGKKPVRAREYVAGPAEAGNIRFRADARYLPALLDEISAFPRGNHDDQVDAMSQALKVLRVPVGKPGARRVVGRIER